MERVAFLVEDTGERIPCLLNPESLVVRRSAGIRRPVSAGGGLTGVDLGDDPVIATGGGRTELELDLLFDTSLLDTSPRGLTGPGDPAPEPPTTDVRDLTRPLWQLAENASPAGAFAGPPLVRFVWGKVWNLLGVIGAVAERVEQFGPDGIPNRSWLRLRLVRVSEPGATPEAPSASPEAIALASAGSGDVRLAVPGAGGDTRTDCYEVVGEERVDVIAARVYGRPWLYRLIAGASDLAAPPFVTPGTVLRVPPVPPLPEPGQDV